MIKFLFFNSRTMLAFEAEREVMLEIFDFGRLKEQTSENAEEFGAFYHLLLEHSMPEEGDPHAIAPAFWHFANGVHGFPAADAASIRADIAKDDYFVYGSTSEHFVFMTDARTEYERQLESHREFGMITMGNA